MITLHRPQPRKTPETLVALVDVVFFLLVFALLIGRMDATSPFQVQPPNAARGSDMPAGGATITLSQDGVALNGEGVSRDDLRERLAALVSSDPTYRIRIQADRRLKLADVFPFVSELEALGAVDVVLVVTPGG